MFWSVDLPRVDADNYVISDPRTGHTYMQQSIRIKLKRAIRDARRESIRWWIQVTVKVKLTHYLCLKTVKDRSVPKPWGQKLSGAAGSRAQAAAGGRARAEPAFPPDWAGSGRRAA
jgi:hypothetical protein